MEHFKKSLQKLKKIRAHIKKNNESWEANLNSMSDFSEEEFQAMQGQINPPAKINSESKKFRRKRRVSDTSNKSFLERITKTKSIAKKTSLNAIDWRSYFLDIRNQKTCGCCWTFATTGTLEGMLAINLPGWTKQYLSPQQLIDCSRDAPNNGCHGGDASVAF